MSSRLSCLTEKMLSLGPGLMLPLTPAVPLSLSLSPQDADIPRDAKLTALGTLMDLSHFSCDAHYQCSCAELNTLVGVAKAAGALGSRLTGGPRAQGAVVKIRGDRRSGSATHGACHVCCWWVCEWVRAIRCTSGSGIMLGFRVGIGRFWADGQGGVQRSGLPTLESIQAPAPLGQGPRMVCKPQRGSSPVPIQSHERVDGVVYPKRVCACM